MSDFSRKIINSLLPKGIVWTPKFDGDLDKFLEGQGDNYDPVIAFLSNLSNIRTPLKTDLLEELEREYGIGKNNSLTDDQRRAFLQSFTVSSQENGTFEELESRLNGSGFNVFVYENDPAQDPDVIISQAFGMVAGGGSAYAGRSDAFAKIDGGELIVNGDKFRQSPNYLPVAGAANSFAGNTSFFAGKFDDYLAIKIEYRVPEQEGDWPLVFFIGGAATRDIDDKIIAIEPVTAPEELRNEYLKIILKYKPLHTWCVSVVDFI